MINVAGIYHNDLVNGPGLRTVLFLQGCPHHCKGCHNSNDWDFSGGFELPSNYLDILDSAITANGLQRNFSVLGGEPLCPQNLEEVDQIVAAVRAAYPNIKIFPFLFFSSSHSGLIPFANTFIAIILYFSLKKYVTYSPL